MKFLKIKIYFFIYFVFLHNINNNYSKEISLGVDLGNGIYNFDRRYKYDGKFLYTLPWYPSLTFHTNENRKYCHDLRMQLIYNKNKNNPYAFGIILSSKKSEKTEIKEKKDHKFDISHDSIFAYVLRYNFLMYNLYPYSTSYKTFYVCLGGNLSYCGKEKMPLNQDTYVPIEKKTTQQYKCYLWFNFSIIASYGFQICSISTCITFDFLLFKIYDKIYPEKKTNKSNKKKNYDETINVYCFGEVNDDTFQWLYPMPKLSIVFNFINYTSDTEKEQIIN